MYSTVAFASQSAVSAYPHALCTREKAYRKFIRYGLLTPVRGGVAHHHRGGVVNGELPLPREGGFQAAAFLRFASSRASTSATWASIAGWLRPFCRAMSCTSLSARSMLGAPFCRARAAEAGRVRLCAAAAYFSNGTRSSGLAPSLTQRSNTKL